VQFFAGNQLTGILEETDQDLNGLSFQPDLSTVFPEFTRTQVEFEDPESDETWGWHH
jgi:hypothetical protein